MRWPNTTYLPQNLHYVVMNELLISCKAPKVAFDPESKPGPACGVFNLNRRLVAPEVLPL